MIIEGWRHSPVEAALIVTVMPVSAILAPQLARLVGADDVVPRAAAGAVLLAGGLAGLGLLPSSNPAWTILPQVLIGLGLGLLLTGLTRVAVSHGGRHRRATRASRSSRATSASSSASCC